MVVGGGLPKKMTEVEGNLRYRTFFHFETDDEWMVRVLFLLKDSKQGNHSILHCAEGAGSTIRFVAKNATGNFVRSSGRRCQRLLSPRGGQ
jgi:hypothetical protein